MSMNPWGGGTRLRPLDIGDLLDETFRVYKRGFVPFITIMALVIVPTTLVSLIAVLLLVGLGFSASQSSFFDNLTPEAGQALLGAGIGAAILMVLFIIVAILAQLVASGAVVLAASNAILGQPVDIRAVYRESFRRSGPLALGGLFVAVPLMALVVTCIGIPVAVFVGLGWALIYQAILLEGHGAIDAMRRSWGLVAGHRWRILISLILIGLIQGLLISVPGGIISTIAVGLLAFSGDSVAMQIGVQAVQSVASAAGQVLFTPIALIASTLLYFDLRVRKEAFDLQQRMPGSDQPGYTGYDQYQGYQQQLQYPQYPSDTAQYPQQPQYPGEPRYPPQPQYPGEMQQPQYPQQPGDTRQSPPRPPQGPPRIPPPPPGPPNR